MSSRWPLGCNLTHVKRHVLRHAVLEAKRKTRLNLRQVDTSLDKLRRVCQVSSDPEAVWDRMQSKSAAPGRLCIRRAKPNQARESKGELDVLLWPAASRIHGSANCLSVLFERRFHCHLDHFTKSNLQKAKVYYRPRGIQNQPGQRIPPGCQPGSKIFQLVTAETNGFFFWNLRLRRLELVKRLTSCAP